VLLREVDVVVVSLAVVEQRFDKHYYWVYMQLYELYGKEQLGNIKRRHHHLLIKNFFSYLIHLRHWEKASY
jgi:hypothetical protein